MLILENISEDEMVANFLKAEIGSPRFGSIIQSLLEITSLDRKIIDFPNTQSLSENNYRLSILDGYRGYLRKELLFKNFPEGVKWKRAALGTGDLKKLRYIKYDYWEKLSGGTRLVSDGARNIKNGVTIYGSSNDQFLAAARHLESGGSFIDPIVVAPRDGADLVILEGHLRLTAFAMAKIAKKKIRTIVGFSPEISRWSLY